MTVIDIDEAASEIRYHIDRLWPGETTFGRLAALTEEVGEVARAMLKRDHARKVGTCRGLTPDEWTWNLQAEVGQVLGVVLDICAMEGWSPSRMLCDLADDLRLRQPEAAPS